MMIQHKRGGFSWFRKEIGFHFNEGQFPNFGIHWNWHPRVFFYVALSPRLKWHNGLR